MSRRTQFASGHDRYGSDAVQSLLLKDSLERGMFPNSASELS